MSLIQKLKIACIGAVALGVANANAFLYDDFSSGTLDPNKWFESTQTMFHDEHFVNPAEGAYHTAHLNESDRETVLMFNNYIFYPGDSLEYDMNYAGGNGNRIHIVDLDNDYRWLGQVGYWNGIEPGGNDPGLYHANVEFDNSGANLFITRPDNSEFFRRLNSSSQQHTFGFGTRTGHNGLAHMDYDNVYINPVPEPSTLVGLGIGAAGLYAPGRRRRH